MSKKIYWSLGILVLALVVILCIFNTANKSEPIVNTVEVLAEGTSATLNGEIKDKGGKDITEYGFRWGTSHDMDRKETIVDNTGVDEQYTVTIDDLKPGNTYYYQAYAVNLKGLGFGEIKSFSIPENQSPEVFIKSPEDNLLVTAGTVVKVTAVATDDIMVESMELYINDTSKTRNDDDSLVYAWDTKDAEPGEYTIKVSARDGEKMGEEVISLIVKEKTNSQTASTSQLEKSVGVQTAAADNPISRGADTKKYPKLSKVQGSYGQFYYRDLSGGRIEIDPNWVANNIVTITLPGLNQKVQVHKKAADKFIQAFTYIKNGTAVVNGKRVPLVSLIYSMDGTFVPRHVNWKSSRGLSNHSWGIAIDINAQGHFGYINSATNPNDPNLILWEKAFKPAGFSWGNAYSDSMHFELLD